MIIGGVAASLLAKPRFTVDLDAMLLLSTQDIPRLMKEAQLEGIAPRTEKAAEFARKNRILLLEHIASDIRIDTSLGVLPFEEEVVERSVVEKLGSVSVRPPTPEDLIILKAVAQRPKDLEDIRVIIQEYPDLDTSRIEHWVKAFGEALDDPDLWTQIELLLRA